MNPISTMMNQSCYVSRHTADTSLLGDEVHDTPEELRCRIDYHQTVSYGRDGDTRPGIATIYLDTDVSERDWFYLDAEYVDTSYLDLTPYDLMSYNLGDVFRESAPHLEYGIARKPVSISHLYDGSGRFHHCEVVI